MARNPAPTRPLVDPDWTERQREVLDLLVAGKTNGEIASELGISLDGAKWHVRELFTRLGLDSREDVAAYWRERNSAGGRLRRFARGLAGFSLVKLAGAGAAVAIAAVAGGAVYLATTGDNGDPATPDATPTATATADGAVPTPIPSETPTASVTDPQVPAEIDGVPVRELRLGEPRAFPGDWLIHYNVNCYGCGGAINPHRAFVMEDGSVVRQRLAGYIEATTGVSGRLTGVVASPDLHLLYSAVCVVEGCGVEGADASATTALVRSVDGGMTWQVVDTFDAGLFLAGIASSDVVVYLLHADEVVQDPILLPSGEVLTPPDSVDPESLFLTSLSIWPDRGLLWWQPTGPSEGKDRRLIDADGNEVIGPPMDVESWDAHEAAGQIYLTWRNPTFDGHYLGAYTANAEPIAYYHWRTPDGEPGVEFWFADAIGPTTVLANVLLRGDAGNPRGTYLMEPVIIDLETGTVHVIQGLTDGLDGNQHPFLEGTAIGPWARVDGSGTCLNVREEPSTTAAIVTCHVDGVLLRDMGDIVQAEGIEWLAIETPSGQPGWVSTEFVAR